MTRRLLAIYLLLTAITLLVVELPFGLTFADREERSLLSSIERDARVIAAAADDSLEAHDDTAARAVAADYQSQTGGRVVIVDEAGMAIADSGDPDGPARNFSSRPEIAAALRGEMAEGLRDSNTLGSSLVFVAVPIVSGGTLRGAVRISYPSSELDARIRRQWIRLGVLSLLVLTGVAAAGLALARSVTGPVRALDTAAARLASGDLAARAPLGMGPPELRDLSVRFNEMADRIQQLVASQRAFVADASHQLRTPLTALRLRLETLLDEPGASADVEASLDEVERLSRLVDGLLALARSEANRPPAVEVDAAAVGRDRVEMWTPLAEERSVTVRYRGPVTAMVHAVDQALEQQLDNLLANAIEVAPTGTTVTVVVAPGPARTEVHVLDEGPGLPDELRVRAFDRFWRPPGAPEGGSGLGLAIVRELARASGGDAELRTVHPHGLDAVVILPTRAGSGRSAPVA